MSIDQNHISVNRLVSFSDINEANKWYTCFTWLMQSAGHWASKMARQVKASASKPNNRTRRPQNPWQLEALATKCDDPSLIPQDPQ